MRDALGDVQSVLVLGGGSEIAQAIVRELAGRGRLRLAVLAARRPEALAGAADELRARGVAVDVVAFDADRTETHASVIGDAFERHGDVDVVVLAFAVLGDQATFEADPEAAVAAAHTNYVASVSAGLVVADRLRAQGHGTLVVLSSVAGERVRAANFVYGSTKAGLDGFAQGLDDALRPAGPRVLVVRPGFVHTKMTAGMPAAPFSTTPEAVATDVVEALRAGRSVVWSPAILRWVFVVLRHLPRAVFRRLPG
jgi:decaprenylphospho-beta-D-erythro-pentofuranosid-2-ulose 2-reductase